MKSPVRELNPDALFHLVMRRWDLVLLVPLLTVLTAGLAWQISPDRYRATARLLIPDQQTVNPFMKDMLEEWSAEQRMPLVQSIFQSHSTSEQVLRKLHRLEPSATPVDVNDAVEAFQKTFEIVGLGGELVLIKVHGQTPAEAYEAAVALVDTFTEQIMRPQRETVRASAAFFQDQLEELRGENSGIDPEGTPLPKANPTSLDGQLSIRRALAEAEVRLVAAEQEVERSESKLRQGSPGGRQIRKYLSEARRELFELNHLYGKDHPELVAAKRRVRSLQQALRRENQEHEAVSAEPGSTDPANPGRTPDAEPSAAAQHQNLLVELKEAATEVELLRHSLLTEELSTFTAGNKVWTVEAPVIPTRSLRPSIWIVILGALVAGLVLALLAVAFFAALDDSLRGEKELAEALGAPSLGRMPRGGA